MARFCKSVTRSSSVVELCEGFLTCSLLRMLRFCCRRLYTPRRLYTYTPLNTPLYIHSPRGGVDGGLNPHHTSLHSIHAVHHASREEQLVQQLVGLGGHCVRLAWQEAWVLNTHVINTRGGMLHLIVHGHRHALGLHKQSKQSASRDLYGMGVIFQGTSEGFLCGGNILAPHRPRTSRIWSSNELPKRKPSQDEHGFNNGRPRKQN